MHSDYILDIFIHYVLPSIDINRLESLEDACRLITLRSEVEIKATRRMWTFLSLHFPELMYIRFPFYRVGIEIVIMREISLL